MPQIFISLLALNLFLAGAPGCSDAPLERPDQVDFGGDRVVQIAVPKDYDHGKKTPLLIALHGYSVTGYVVLAITGLRDLNDVENVIVAAPEGVIGDDGAPSWNIEGTCCNQHDTDDVAYIVGLVEEISSVYNVDRDRVYVFGHSNGGLMAYHLACERPDVFAGIASLAGPTVGDSCQPSEPISILHIQGTEDDSISIDGGTFSTGVPYLGSFAGLETWANHNGCGDDWQDGTPLDIEIDLPGAETTVTNNASCPPDIGIEMWTIEGGGHNPGFHQDDFPSELFRWFSFSAQQK
jgi:polyhydroxybutyrate depolymerase